MDDSYIIIRVYNNEIIAVYYYYKSNQKYLMNNYPICFIVNFNRVGYLFMLLSLSSIIDLLSTKHKFYLGKEIFKVDISAKLNQVYIQD